MGGIGWSVSGRGDTGREDRWRELMAAAQDGDRACYERLLTEILPLLRGLVRRRVRDPAAVEDVVQNVLLSLHRARHTYRPERRFGPWLRAIARNAVIDWGRQHSRRSRREVVLPSEDGFPEIGELPQEAPRLSPELEQALGELPPVQREAVQLLQLEGLSVAEAAVRAGITPGALKVRAHRGYRALRTRLGATNK